MPHILGVYFSPTFKVLSLSLAILALTSACSKSDDRTKVKQLVEGLVEDANQQNVKGIVSKLSEDFKGQQQIDKPSAKRIIAGQLLRPGWKKVFLSDLEIEKKDTEFLAKAEVTMARGNAVQTLKDIVPTNADLFEFDLRISKNESGEFLIKSAKYRRKRWPSK